MKIFREISLGFLTAITSSLVILGAIMVSMTEGLSLVVPTLEPTLTLPVLEETAIAGIPTATRPPQTPTSLVLVTNTVISANSCASPTPNGWVNYMTSQQGDDLNAIASDRGVDVKTLMDANCLSYLRLPPNSNLSVPPLPTPTLTPSLTPTFTSTVTASFTPSQTICPNPPAGWVRYTIRSGDTLSSLVGQVGSSVQDIMRFNCLSNIYIRTGQIIYLPRLPASSPSPTQRPSATRTPVPANTRTIAPTLKPTGTNIATLTSTFIDTATFTFTPSFTITPTFTFTPPFTFTPSFTSTKTTISIVTATNPPTATPLSTETPSTPGP
jgi:LysM repeat protein